MLTPLQTRIAELVAGLPQARSFALAGAGGLLVRGLIDRSTRDLDYFTVPGEEEAVMALRDALERALDNAGIDHRRQRDLPTFVRIEVRDGEDVCEVDLAVAGPFCRVVCRPEARRARYGIPSRRAAIGQSARPSLAASPIR